MKKIIIIFLTVCLSANLIFSANASESEMDTSNGLEVITYDYITKKESISVISHTDEDSIGGLSTKETNNTGTIFAPAYIPNTLQIASENEGDATDSIIPGSTMHTVNNINTFPYCAVTYLRLGQDTTGNGVANSWSNGTGFMVGNKAMATAGHCFWSGTYGWVEECRTYIKQNSTTLGSTYYYPASWTVPSNYTSSLNYQYDWCVITMQNNLGRTTGYFGFGYNGNMTGNTYTLSGYPANHLYKQYWATGTVTSETSLVCYYGISMLGGQSGSPVYDSNYTVWAINTYEGGTFNQGNKITQYCADLMNIARAAS